MMQQKAFKRLMIIKLGLLNFIEFAWNKKSTNSVAYNCRI